MKSLKLLAEILYFCFVGLPLAGIVITMVYFIYSVKDIISWTKKILK